MNYFMSDLHGASKEYFEMKNRIGLGNNDDLYLLGDIFDGNQKNPDACLEILRDIMKHDNIHLLLGDHEYVHVMNYITQKNGKDGEEWIQYISSPVFGGTALLHHMTNRLSEREKEKYFSFLVSCDMTDFIKIGSRYFYLVHGSPAAYKMGDIGTWQKDVVTVELSMQHNYSMAIASDPNIHLPKNIEMNSISIIAGHIPTKYVLGETESADARSQKVIFRNRKMYIDCGCNGDTIGQLEDGWRSNLACVGIDAAGFFTEYLIQE